MKKKFLLYVVLYFLYVLIILVNSFNFEYAIIKLAVLFCPLFLMANTSIGKWLMRYVRGMYYKLKTKSHCSKLRIGEGVTLMHPERIKIGNNVEILKQACIAPLVQYNGKSYPSLVEIGNNVSIGAFDRIASMNKVIIEDNVLFAAFVHITDHSHGYEDIKLPIVNQDVFSKGEIRICEGAWLAFGCHILSGVTVGKHSVVAANSVVTKDVPEYTVVAGNPAKIVCRYDFEEQRWKKVKK